jgi:type II secretory ATPase GspE/PulE/Tfp pilus assembly ATPase PilB-like protein
MLRLGVNSFLLSSALRGVISQRLLRTLCPRCKRTYAIPAPHLFDEIKTMMQPGEGQHLCGPQGCDECHMTGYSGRTGVFEMLRVTPDIRELIEHNAPVTALRKKAIEEGMLEFRQSAMLKVARGETSIEEVVRVIPSEYLK